MDSMHHKAIGIDVHKEVMVVTYVEENKETKDKQFITKSFGAYPEDLQALANWVVSMGCSNVAMESTGIYWICVYEALELVGIKATVANASHLAKVPGRKTDVSDSQWIAELHMAGLLRASHIPCKIFREAREFTRYRVGLVQDLAKEKNRVHRHLEANGIKLSSTFSRILGKSGRNVIDAIIQGKSLKSKDLELILHKRMHSKIPEIIRALKRPLSNKSRALLKIMYNKIIELESIISQVEIEADEILAPYTKMRQIIETIPGMDSTASAAITAEISDNLNSFERKKNLASWIGISPGNNESAGKKKALELQKGTDLLGGF